MRTFNYISQKLQVKKARNHIIFWAVFIIYELVVYLFSFGRLPGLVVYFYYYACNIGIFYCQVAVLNLTLGGHKPNYFKLIILFFLELTGFSALKITADVAILGDTHNGVSLFNNFKIAATMDILRNIYFVAFGTLYWTITNINNYQKKADAAEISQLKSAKENSDLEVRLAKSQNAYLQQQINPHLLFNALNFIHSSVYKLSHLAAENIILLSDIMRYSLEETDADGKTNLGNEAEQIENLIRINQFRFDYPLDISYNIKGDLSAHKIIPLVLMTLAENVFKHGDLTDKPAHIRLSVAVNGELKFYTYNHKRPVPPVKRVKSIGLENIKTRLNYTYGTDYRLVVNETDDIYQSELTLNL